MPDTKTTATETTENPSDKEREPSARRAQPDADDHDGWSGVRRRTVPPPAPEPPDE